MSDYPSGIVTRTDYQDEQKAKNQRARQLLEELANESEANLVPYHDTMMIGRGVLYRITKRCICCGTPENEVIHD